jgi:hypothetical protein
MKQNFIVSHADIQNLIASPDIKNRRFRFEDSCNRRQRRDYGGYTFLLRIDERYRMLYDKRWPARFREDQKREI